MSQTYNIHLNRYEKAILSDARLPREFCSILAGVSRISRLSRYDTDTHIQTIWDSSTNIIGPTLFFFIWWVLTEARKQNIRRLYFLARDGQILMRIAETIQKQYPFGIECRYLFGSRQAWLVPSIKSIDEKELSWIMSDWWYSISVYSVCHRLGISPDEAEEFLQAHGFSKERYAQALDARGKGRLKECLRSENFQQWFQRRSRADFERTFGYLKQEGILDGVAYGLVDIGWRGNQQYSLNKILEKAGCAVRGTHGYYLGLTEALKKHPQDHAHAFLFDLSSSAQRIYLRNNHLYEAFASSAEGRTVKFTQKDGRYHAVFADPVSGQEVADWGIEVQHQGILHFCQEFLVRCQESFLTEQNYYPVLEKILYAFINRPGKEEAATYGSFPMDGEMTESNVREIAPVITRREFWVACVHLKSFSLFWVQASLRRSHLWPEYGLWRAILPLVIRGYFVLSRWIDMV